MKQNSSILFHFMPNSLINHYRGAVCAAITFTMCFLASARAVDRLEYPDSFDPTKGFPGAQRDLRKIYLHLAGSLEYYGSPEPYFRHVAEEDEKVEKLYLQMTGKRTSIRPESISDDKLDQFAKNWNHLAPKLGLANLAKQVGATIRSALTANDDTRSSVRVLLSQRQASLHNQLTGRSEANAPVETFNDEIAILADAPDSQFHSVREQLDQIFAALNKGLSKGDADNIKAFILRVLSDTSLAAESEFEAGNVSWALAVEKSPGAYAVTQEIRLSPEERRRFSALLAHDHFTKTEFPSLDAFYSSPAYDRLSDAGKDQLSMRVWAGIRGGVTH